VLDARVLDQDQLCSLCPGQQDSIKAEPTEHAAIAATRWNELIDRNRGFDDVISMLIQALDTRHRWCEEAPFDHVG